MRRLLCCLILLGALAGCTPEEMAFWEAYGNQIPTTCHDAVDRYWPDSSKPWAHRIVQRESGGDATAQNRRSSAAGCFQMMRVHAWRFDQVGCSWVDRYAAWCNTLAALHLYLEQGSRPWR